ncbi:hypothetical protein F4806DRAFT_494624 [Annulohypoxylon nitens]|nr:hypothetical protein F4806DRAFT_494624 [Annulohypoxylon nitens]
MGFLRISFKKKPFDVVDLEAFDLDETNLNGTGLWSNKLLRLVTIRVTLSRRMIRGEFNLFEDPIKLMLSMERSLFELQAFSKQGFIFSQISLKWPCIAGFLVTEIFKLLEIATKTTHTLLQKISVWDRLRHQLFPQIPLVEGKTFTETEMLISKYEKAFSNVLDLLGKICLAGLNNALYRETPADAEDLQEIAQTLEGEAIDTWSAYSVESEVVSEQPSLSFLPLCLQGVDEPSTKREKVALLDTGATIDAISTTLASDMKLNIQRSEQHAMVQTAAQDKELPVIGKVHLNLRWKSNDGRIRGGARVWMQVVEGLNVEILLSHDFIQNKWAEVWKIAKESSPPSPQMDALLFHRHTKKQKQLKKHTGSSAYRGIWTELMLKGKVAFPS